MPRYITTPIIQTETETRRIATTILPVPPINIADTYIQTTSPERLDILAQQFYGDVNLWWVIATANGLGKGSIVVPANIKLRIPSANNLNELINFKNTNR